MTSMIPVNPARVEILREGDMIALYAGHATTASATVERPVGRDDFTPGGFVTLWTTMGRFDVPDDSTIDVLAWAPMPINRLEISPW
jgi:hypothetical protein